MSVSHLRKDSLSLNCLNSSVSSLSTAVITRANALSCSMRAFCLSEFWRALWYAVSAATFDGMSWMISLWTRSESVQGMPPNWLLPRPGEHAACGKFAQKRAQRQYADRTVLKRSIAQVNAAATGDHACAMQFRESAAVLWAPARTRFHFDPDGKRAAAPYEIDLRPGRRPIVREFASAT